jgi:hypothetical protein
MSEVGALAKCGLCPAAFGWRNRFSPQIQLGNHTDVRHPITTITDPVNHPPHYKSHPSGIECIEITQHMNFLLGSAVKYIWRADEKGKPIEDLRKAAWYIEREIQRREASE